MKLPPIKVKGYAGNELNHHDPSFLKKALPYFEFLDHYFRYSVKGLNNIKPHKPCLVVMNHGVIPFDGFLLTKHLYQERGIAPRGLGAGFLFNLPLISDFFLKGGAVNANPRNAKALLKEGHCVLLAPGGIYEALVSRPGMKRIPWERRYGFVKVAIETGADIIPTYCTGLNEVYYNSDFLLKLRIKILELTRFSIPFFYGVGLLPFPYKLTHYIGKPISTKKKKGEKPEVALRRIHQEVVKAMQQLQIEGTK